MDLEYENLVRRIETLLDRKEYVLVAIDGYCAAGKTTLAAALADTFARPVTCNVFHMDDFFLRPEQRTRERLAEVGGNVDYERFHEEVLTPVLRHTPFSYRPYDCHTLRLAEPVSISPQRLSVIEGTYSMHPSLAPAYDLSVFMRIPDPVQKERIMRRNPALANRFFEEWIPMEHRYFTGMQTQQRCDVVMMTNEH